MTDAEAEAMLAAAARTSQALYARREPRGIGSQVKAAASHVRVADEEWARRSAQRQAEAERAERVAASVAGAKVPDLYRTARLLDWARVPEDSIEAYETASGKLAAAFTTPGIYALCGEIGAGKTYMACALINAFCRAGRSARYVKAAQYVEDLRSTWKSSEAGAESRYARQFGAYKLLVIDEWQVRRGTADEDMHLLRLIDRRYEAAGTTVIVSNHLSKEEFASTIDARVADRICDGGGIILCNWPSLRGRIAK
jgi:DNA replication protein DnaC